MNRLKLTIYAVSTITLSMLIIGCATTQPRPIEQLTSEAKVQASRKIDKTLLIFPVTGGEKYEQSIWSIKPKPPKINNEEFLLLLLGGLQKSGLFREVTTLATSDYALRAEVIFQDITMPGMTNTLMLLVHYELMDLENDRIIWKENIYTQSELSSKDIFAGEVRVVRLLEKGLVANMNTLIQRIEQRFSN